MQDPSPDRAPLLPKLRGQFAEFLNHGSPERLGILYLTTCVGLGYWPHTNSLEAFLDSMGSLTSPKTAPHHVSTLWGADLPTPRPTRLPPDNHRRVELPSCVTPSLTYYKLGSQTDPEATPEGITKDQRG